MSCASDDEDGTENDTEYDIGIRDSILSLTESISTQVHSDQNVSSRRSIMSCLLF